MTTLRPLLVSGGLLALLLGAAPAPGTSVSATPSHTYALGDRDPMLRPTSVAVDAVGQVWVADGAKNRVLVFSASGELVQTLRRAAGKPLSRPMAIATSSDGAVWIADAGNSRLVVVHANTPEERSIAVSEKLGAVDLTDVEVSEDGATAWAVDNDGHRVLTLDVAS